MIADTDSANPIFEDAEVEAALNMQSSQFLYLSPQSQSSGLGAQSQVQVYSLYRAAAMLLRALASNKSRLASVTQLLDVKLSPKEAAVALRDMAKDWMEMEQNSGAFAIAEMIPNEFAARERLRDSWMRYAA